MGYFLPETKCYLIMNKQNSTDETTNRIVIEEIDPEEINKIWDSLPEIRSALQ